MKKRQFKKILIWSASVFSFLVIVLAVHIYIVTRPKAPDPYLRVMARIDIKQPITQDDANKIGTWLHHQNGVDNVLVNPTSDIAVFTYFPAKTSSAEIVSNFNSNLNYKGVQYIPTEAELESSCPAANSSTFKVYNFFKQLF